MITSDTYLIKLPLSLPVTIISFIVHVQCLPVCKPLPIFKTIGLDKHNF